MYGDQAAACSWQLGVHMRSACFRLAGHAVVRAACLGMRTATMRTEGTSSGLCAHMFAYMNRCWPCLPAFLLLADQPPA